MKMRAAAPSEPKSNRFERLKLVYDFLKHLTTLSSGSILVILALAEKFVKDPGASKKLFLGMGFFLTTVLLSLISMVILTVNVDRRTIDDRSANVFAGCFGLAAGAFFFAMVLVVRALYSQYG